MVTAFIDSEQTTLTGLTLRAYLLGLLQVLLVCLGAPYAIWVLGSSELTWSFFPIGVGFPFLCLVLSNILLKILRPAWALRPAELTTVVIMGLVVTGIPIFMVGVFLAIPTTPYYLVSPENQWAEYVLTHLPSWLLPGNDHQAMTWFFEGLPTGLSIPWGIIVNAWAIPLFWWLSFIWTLYFVCFALVVIMRRQWMEHERLAFPLMEVPQTLTRAGDGISPIPRIMRSPLFWIGVALPVSIALWNICSFFQPIMHQIPWGYTIPLARGFPPVNIILNFPVIGFMYFANLDVTFSIWFFYIITLVEEGILNRFNMGVTRTDTFVWGLPSTSWQCWGAFIVMVLWGLWMARDHLRAVVGKAWNRNHPIDDSGELLSYRVALGGFLLGVVYMLAWLHRAGLPYHAAVIFLASVLIAYLGITHIVIQTGIYYTTTPIVGQAMVVATLGTDPITPSGLGALGLSYSFFGDVQSIFMPAAAHATKLHDVMRTGRRGLCFAIATAVLVGFTASILYIVYMGYEQGASNFRSWFFQVSSGAGVQAFEAVATKIKTPEPVDIQKLTFLGGGAVTMAILTMLQYRFPWWPLHPIGFSIASVWMIRNQVAAIFMVWMLKSLILHFGGISLFKKAAPFFIGLIVGHFLGIGLSFIVDMIFFPGVGHPILNG